MTRLVGQWEMDERLTAILALQRRLDGWRRQHEEQLAKARIKEDDP
ncbi:hypothetical protein [Blautia producta]|uniref:Uncharacterized protein n=1 Tax=Blautia producta ATCC 27340 = DSM 2950 TaxID=1121114 RepID=A0ABX6J990_9FIRM|nr:hypothetical protein [Blautia producta]QIB56055.1 hypothetical protein GXM18_14975 [Blautia producta ATCC 27340 = DSM 2950]